MTWMRNPRIVDLVAAGVFLIASVIDVLGNAAAEGPPWGNVAGASAIAAALLVRRRAPVAAALAFYAILIVFALWLSPPPELAVPFFGLLFFPYAAGVYRGRLGAAVVLGALPATVIAVNLITGLENPVGNALFPTAVGVAGFIVGRAVRGRLELAAELHEAALLAQEEDDADAARAVLAERRRIAREMHDVVAHSISVMVVQAGGARKILERDPARAVAAGAQIECVGRDALLEMRRLLGVLHPREGEPEMAPQPGLHELESLLERARSVGLPVRLHEQGERRCLPAGTDLAVYRVLQEALTNALKHSGPAPTDVRLSWLEDAVELHVLDAGGGANGLVEGQGLIGMRERVRLYGGDLRVGRCLEGGFEVKARIPFGTEETV